MAVTKPTLPPKPKPRPKKKPEPPEKRYVCTTCGREYLKQMGNFSKLNVPKYDGNDGYCTTCVECVNTFYEERLKMYDGNTAKAVRRVCEWLDIYWSPRVFEKMVGGITNYFSKVALMTKGVSWENTLNEEAEKPILEAGAVNPTDMPVIDDVMEEAVSIFGEGYDVDAYPFMLSSYKGYIEPLGDEATASQVKNARFLAALEYRVMDAIKHDKQNASALSSSLSRAIKDSGFDTVVKRDNDEEHQPFGVWLEQIERYAPAEFVHDSPYQDMDSQEEYYTRFVRRPIENLLNRASQKQTDELAITDEEAASVDVGDTDD